MTGERDETLEAAAKKLAESWGGRPMRESKRRIALYCERNETAKYIGHVLGIDGFGFGAPVGGRQFDIIILALPPDGLSPEMHRWWQECGSHRLAPGGEVVVL